MGGSFYVENHKPEKRTFLEAVYYISHSLYKCITRGGRDTQETPLEPPLGIGALVEEDYRRLFNGRSR